MLDPKIISNQKIAERALIQAQKMAENAVTNIDAAVNAFRSNGLTDIDLNGLLNVRRSIAYLAGRVDNEKKILLHTLEPPASKSA